MIRLHGPTYQYQGEKLSYPTPILICDHHYNEELRCFPVQKLLENSTCDSKKHVLIFDHVLQHDDILSQYPHIYFPSFLARENQEFIDQHIVPDWTNKNQIFNFMINKPRPHRIRLLKMLKEFNLNSYCYSLAWRTNPVNSVPVTDYRIGPEVVLDRGVQNGNFCNAYTYQKLLQKTVFEPSYISLITEPCFYERETIITEKTLMAIYGGTLPIWVGGWRIPDYMRSIGFDIFDDVIDHGYQDLTDPMDRCYSAVQRNIELLITWNSFSLTHIERLKRNLELLESNHFKQLCQMKFDQLPTNIQKNYIFSDLRG
jgi:hypothetical protein